MAAADYFSQVQKIYVAYYGRPADPAGLSYWGSRLDAAGGNLSSIINAFGTSSESTALYTGTDSAKVTAIYQQLFNRAPDTAGLNFYTGELTAGRMTAASIALNVANGASGTDATYLSNKLTVASAFTDALNVDSAAAVAYAGTSAATSARSLISGVTTSAATTNVASTVSSIKSGGGAAAGQTFTLTTAATDVVAGTASNDTITAPAGTLQASDVISDASTTDADVLNVTINSYSSVQSLISSVETINVTGVYTSAGLDAQNVVNAKALNLTTGIAGGTGTLVNASVQKVQAVKSGNNIDTLNVNAATYTGGTGGSLAVDAGTASTVTIGATGNTGTDAYTVNPIKNSTLNLRGGSDGTDTFTVTLPGASITLDVDNAAATTGDIDNLNIVSSGSALNTITVNSADDKLVDSGTGDKLVISGTQSVTFTGDLDALVGNGTRLTNVALEKATGYTGTVTWNSNNSLTSGNLNRAVGLDVINVTTTATGVNLLVNENTTVNLAINNGTRLYNVDNNTTTATTAGSGTLKLGLTGDSAANATQTAISTGANVGTLVIANATRASTITLLDTTTGTTADTVVITGDKALTITAWNATAGEVLTASTFTGALTATSANAGATIIGGSGADVLTGGSDLADSISGGAGDDILSGGVGSTTDTLVGGLGSDRFVLTGNVASADRIADFSVSGTNGTDVLAISMAGLTGTSSAALDAKAGGDSVTLAAGATVGVAHITAATTLTSASNIIVLDGTFATQALMETAVEAGGTRQITLGGSNTSGDDYFILWSDGTNAYFGYLNDTGTATTFSSGANTTYNNVVTLAGVTSVDAVTASNFLFIA